MIVINLNDLIESRYKTIHQIMYKMKDKKWRKEQEFNFYIHESSNTKTEQQFYNLRLQKHETDFDVTKLRWWWLN